MATSSPDIKLIDCPACGSPIYARASWEFQPTELIKTIQVESTLQGIQVAHDCLPKATRSGPCPMTST